MKAYKFTSMSRFKRDKAAANRKMLKIVQAYALKWGTIAVMKILAKYIDTVWPDPKY